MSMVGLQHATRDCKPCKVTLQGVCITSVKHNNSDLRKEYFYFSQGALMVRCFLRQKSTVWISSLSTRWFCQSEWPNAELKSSPNFPKTNYSSLTWKVLLFALAQKYSIHLGYFLLKTCHRELSKIAQSVLTAANFNLIIHLKRESRILTK